MKLINSVGVVAACYQGIMGHKAVEERLGESDIKKGEICIVLLV